MPMTPGYHAGGLLLHNPISAVEHLVSMGYQCVAIRPRWGGLIPGEKHFDETWTRLLNVGRLHRCQIIVDTEAAFVHDADEMGLPSLAESDAGRADITMRWCEQWIRAAEQRPGTMLTIGSGVWPRDEYSVGLGETTLERLAARLETLCDSACRRGVTLAMRPAIGHAIASVAEFERLCQWLPVACDLGLAADVGEMIAAGEMPLGARLHRNADRLRLVYLCDHRSPGTPPRNVPAGSIGRDDVPIGQGELTLARVVASLEQMDFDGPVVLRVEGQSEQGLQIPRQGMQHLHQCGAFAART